MNSEEKEIRDVLLGKTIPGEDGRLEVIPQGEFRIPVGIGDGAGAVRIFGVTHLSHGYESKLDEKSTLLAAQTCMRNIGRGLNLREQPETSACLIRYILTRPAVLTFRYRDGIPILTAWTGRGLTGWISLWRAVRSFEKQLPEGIRLSEEKPPEEVKEKKKKKSRRGRHKNQPEEASSLEEQDSPEPDSPQDLGAEPQEEWAEDTSQQEETIQ